MALDAGRWELESGVEGRGWEDGVPGQLASVVA